MDANICGKSYNEWELYTPTWRQWLSLGRERRRVTHLVGIYVYLYFFRKRKRAIKANTKQTQISGVPNHNELSLHTH